MNRGVGAFVLGAGAAVLPALPAAGADDATVAELRRVIAEQQQQLERQARLLEALERRVDRLASEGPAEAPSKPEAGAVRSGSQETALSLSGQVNRAVLVAGDGAETEVFHVDNDNSSTRVRLIGEVPVGEELLLGGRVEVEIQSNPSDRVNQDEPEVGPDGFDERKLELYVESERLGTLWLGQGSTASDGASETDLSGSTVIGKSDIKDFAGGLIFRRSDTGTLVDDEGRIRDVYSNLDGFSRQDRLRYDTPELAGFTLSGSVFSEAGGDAWDLALRHKGQYGPFKAAWAAAYGEPGGGETDHQVSGSASVAHEAGLSLTVAAGTTEREAGDDPDFWYAKVGYSGSWLALGDTHLAADFMRAEDLGLPGDEAETYGAFVVQDLEGLGTQLYIGVRNHELERSGTPTDDILAAMAGARVKF